MQFRILPVAVALLAVVVVVMAADPPTVDALHSKCWHHDKKWWIAENEEVDVEAEKTAFPANYEAMGWHKYKSGKCSYKRRYVDCPHKDHWHHREDHWDRHYGFYRYGHTCANDDQCCSHNCLQTTNVTTTKICCRHNTVGFNATCDPSNNKCCSNKCVNTTDTGFQFRCSF